MSIMPVSLASSLASNSSRVEMRNVSRSFKASDRSRNVCFTFSKAAGTSSAAPSRLTWNLSPPVRIFAKAVPCSKSRGPSSKRKGTPRRSHSKNLLPGFRFTRLSTWTRNPTPLRLASNLSAASKMDACNSGSLENIGKMTTWVAANTGGSTRPSSSECTMMTAPMRRVDTPQDEAQTYSEVCSSDTYFTSKALAKFWPKK
mmetsp:Transcript_95751/g.239924  ORF Transcript_95751/g.239924 Transcript_95751/m.239924 type:complete len:201 (-) Transcript_95751:1073-1675(-)